MNAWEGSTKLILTDTKTGKDKVVESKNVFKADNIAKYCAPYGGVISYLKSKNIKAYSHLVGGILIFDKTIPENSFTMPAGTKMIANGSINISNNNFPELGSYNTSESEITNNSIKLVYDYTTNQATGNISSICLTSDIGGYIGYGNGSKSWNKQLKDVSLAYVGNNYGLTLIDQGIENNSNYRYAINQSGYACELIGINFTTKIARFGIIKTPGIDRIDLLNKLYTTSGGSVESYFDEAFDINFDLPSGYSASWNESNIYGSGTKIYAIATTRNSYVGPGGSFMVLEFDMDSRTCNTIEIINPSDNINLSRSGVSYIGDHKLLAMDYDNKYAVYYIDSDADEATQIADSSSALWRGNNTGSNFINMNGLYIANGQNTVVIFDPINKTLYPTNGNKAYSSSSAINDSSTKYNPNYQIFIQNARLSANPLYLATINNLSEPVYKTDSQTMKVIYTLTRQQS